MVKTVRAHDFKSADLVGGHVVLDLVNTVTSRDAEPIDWLDGYPRLLEWAALTGEFDAATLDALRRAGEADPHAAELALDRTKELREAVHDVVTAIVRGGQAPPRAVDRLERHWKDAVAHARLAVVARRLRREADVATSGLDYLDHELALRALDALGSLPLDRTRICAGQRCGWVFVDRSRGGQRRWCDMATCGNAAKGRAHYRRRRQGRRQGPAG